MTSLIEPMSIVIIADCEITSVLLTQMTVQLVASIILLLQWENWPSVCFFINQ